MEIVSNQPKRNIKIKCPQIENISKNIEITLKRNKQILKLKYTILKKKKITIGALTSQKKKMSNLEAMSTEINQSEKYKGKGIKKNEHNRVLRDAIKHIIVP